MTPLEQLEAAIAGLRGEPLAGRLRLFEHRTLAEDSVRVIAETEDLDEDIVLAVIDAVWQLHAEVLGLNDDPDEVAAEAHTDVRRVLYRMADPTVVLRTDIQKLAFARLKGALVDESEVIPARRRFTEAVDVAKKLWGDR